VPLEGPSPFRCGITFLVLGAPLSVVKCWRFDADKRLANRERIILKGKLIFLIRDLDSCPIGGTDIRPGFTGAHAHRKK
jgi:hypothetical protein